MNLLGRYHRIMDRLFEDHKEHQLLREILYELRHDTRLLRDIYGLLYAQQIAIVARFIITQGETTMPTQSPLLGLAPSATGTFTAVPVDASGNAVTLAAGTVPVWTSDDSSDVVTAASDGLSATVLVSSSAVVGSNHTLSVAMPDGSATSPNALPILSGGGTPQPVASFVVTQS